jgi:uncharacterized protein (DUF362 family)
MTRIDGTTRRDFLQKCAIGVAALPSAMKVPLLADPQAAAIAKSRVVLARDPSLRPNGDSMDSSRILRLLDRAMQSLFDKDHPAEPWKKLVSPGEMVGIKINTLGGRILSTSVPLVEAICERLQQAGIRAGDITIWETDTSGLERAGFRVSTDRNRVQCLGTDRVGYEEGLATYGIVSSRLSKILTQRCDVLINVPVLKDHEISGVTAAMKNMYGAISDAVRYHPNGCDPGIADINALPQIRSKLRLHICDATTACYEGGPLYKPQFAWHHNSLLVSQDPVALDYTGWQIIEKKRADMELKTLEADGRLPRYIATAADPRHQLGVNDPLHIELVKV